MLKRLWAHDAAEQLKLGKTVQVRPRGYSMKGRIGDGDLVTLTPCHTQDLKPGAIVLVRIQGRRFSHIVLHQILERVDANFLIGNAQGRQDGWVSEADIFGVVSDIQTSPYPLP
jgi:hypothetical protein